MNQPYCEVCGRNTNPIDLEFIAISIFKQGWTCDTCRKEIEQDLKPKEEENEVL